MVTSESVTRAAIASTYEQIRPYVRRTPVFDVAAEDFGLTGFSPTLKLEFTQHSGSFKARGAFANLLMREVPGVGVAAASGGNHGAAVAYAAMRLGRKARIFVPEISSPAKIARIRGYGADLAVGGNVYAEALAACEAYIVRRARCRCMPSIRSRPCWARGASASSWRNRRQTSTPFWWLSAAAA